MKDKIDKEIRHKVRDQIWSGNQVTYQVRDQVFTLSYLQVYYQVWDQVYFKLKREIG